MDSYLSSSGTGSLAPGFRFHPTDEELVWYYLRRKLCRKPFRFDAISEIDIYKVEPWDLPDKSRLKSRDLEWYFFSVLDKKYGNGSRTNRATDRGYWKTTGKDRAVYHGTKIVGMKKTLVYHSGRAPLGGRTNWVMHEYRLIDEEMEKAGLVQDAFVLCRIFQKSGSGPKNGERYGAPFIEEEWEDDELDMVPVGECMYELPVSDDACPDAYLDENDLEQILSAVGPLPESPIPLNFAYGDDNLYIEQSTNFVGDENEYVEESKNFVVDENNHVDEQADGKTLFNLPVQYDMEGKSVKHEYIAQPSYTDESNNNAEKNPVDVDYLLDESFLDAMDNPQFGEGSFIETNDLINQSAEVDLSSFKMPDEYFQFFDATDDNLQNICFVDYSDMMMGNETLPSDPASSLVPYKDLKEGIEQNYAEGKQELEGHNDVSSSKQAQTKPGSDFQYPFMEQASQMLGKIHAPPAFASEFPTKDATVHMNSASSSSIHVTAGMIQIRNVTLSGSEMDWSFGKHGHVNIILSFGMSRGDDYSADCQPASSLLSDKANNNSAISRGWFYFMFMLVIFLTMSSKIGTFICAN